MRLKTIWAGFVAAALLAVTGCATAPALQQGPQPSQISQIKPLQGPPLILISIDGFRADYIDRGVTPNLKALADQGAYAAMRPSFPSLTFPNHYTLVTGRRPDETGIIANTMQDPSRPGVTFKMSDATQVTDGFWWQAALPMWDSVVKAGGRSAVEFWPGSEAEVDGLRPTYYTPYDGKVTNDQRVDQILAWLDLPAGQRPQALLLYFDVVDHAGHSYGPDSQEVNDAAASVDEAIGRLRDGLKARGIDPNMIIVADHGMAGISLDRAYFLEDYLPAGSYDAVVQGPEAEINPTPGHEADLQKLTHMAFPHMKCWDKANIPAKYHYGHNARIPAVMCLGDPGWMVVTTHAKGIWGNKGAHGYDQTSKEMAALFIAHGPNVRPGVLLPSFDNVSVYDLEMHFLGLTPQPNDGDLTPFQKALK